MATRKTLAQHRTPPRLTGATLLYEWRTGVSEPPLCCECGDGTAWALCATCLKTICSTTRCRSAHAHGHGDTWSEMPIPKTRVSRANEPSYPSGT